ncbi:MAG: 2-amino-4-hydroxy-6-hydroxymethyldihydropteridine diphosphokinase [Pseudomonadota bacterium]
MRLQPKSCHESVTRCLISYGSNLSNDLGESQNLIELALSGLSSKGIHIVKKSGHFRSSAFPIGSGPDFINGVVLCDAQNQPAHKIIEIVHEVEATLGRVRQKRWGARVIDLDLLDHTGQVLPDAATAMHWRELPIQDQMTQTPDQLLLPHPRIQDRAFVLVPLKVVCPDFTHPATGSTVDQMLSQLTPQDIADVRAI